MEVGRWVRFGEFDPAFADTGHWTRCLAVRVFDLRRLLAAVVMGNRP